MLKINTLRTKLLLSFILISAGYVVVSYLFILNIINAKFLIVLLATVPSIIFVIIVIWIKKHLTQPMQLLKNGLEKISYGSLSHRIKIDSNNEFSFWATSSTKWPKKSKI